MPADLLTDFHQFLSEYRAAWNRCDAETINKMLSKDLAVRWAYPDNQVHEWGYENATQGWHQAFKNFADCDPKWSFEDVTLAQTGPNEAFVAYWVTFEVDGVPTEDKTFFLETYRREENGWKKIREHVECGAKKNLSR